MTQTDGILEYMKRNGSITPHEALTALACARLGARIYDLKARGHKITTIIERGQNRFGLPTHWARYILLKEATPCHN